MKISATSPPTFAALLRKNVPPYRDGRFWIIQGVNLLALMAILKAPYSGADKSSLNKALEGAFAVQLFVLAFLLATISSAVLFGLRGMLHTTVVVSLIALPSLINWNSSPYGQVILARLVVLELLAIVIAILVSREKSARQNMQNLNEKMKEIILEKERYFKLASEAQENERRRISRDLHDDSLQLLATVMHQLDGAISATEPEKAQMQMQRAKETITQTTDAIRRYCEELRPMLLETLGLIPSVEWIGQELERSTGIKVEFESEGEARPIRSQDMIHIFRVMQEAFHNIEKHSRATAVRVLWNTGSEDFQITVTDNGIGMWNFGPTPARSLGIQGMYERMELVGGSLEIESQPGFGTKVSLRVPFG